MQDRSLPARASTLIDLFDKNPDMVPAEPILLPQLCEKYEHEDSRYSLATWVVRAGRPDVLRWLYTQAILAEDKIKQEKGYTKGPNNFRLHYAVVCRLPQNEMDEIIQTSSRSVFYTLYNKKVAIDYAVLEQDRQVLNYLLLKRHEINYTNTCSHCIRLTTALHYAVELLDVDIIKDLLADGYSCEARDADGNTPIHTLLQQRGDISHALTVLMPHIIRRVNKPNNADITPFMLAVLSGRENLVKHLLAMKNTTNNTKLVSQENINRALQLAAREENTKMVALLLPVVTNMREQDRAQLLNAPKEKTRGELRKISNPTLYTSRSSYAAPRTDIGETTPLIKRQDSLTYEYDPIFPKGGRIL